MAATDSSAYCGPYSAQTLPATTPSFPHMQENYGGVSVGGGFSFGHASGSFGPVVSDQGYHGASVGSPIVDATSLSQIVQ